MSDKRHGFVWWVSRAIPFLGYMLALEDENAKLKKERDALLTRLMEITTGAGLETEVPADNSDAQVQPKRYLNLEQYLARAEETSRQEFLASLGMKSAKDWANYVRTGEWLKEELAEPAPSCPAPSNGEAK